MEFSTPELVCLKHELREKPDPFLERKCIVYLVRYLSFRIHIPVEMAPMN